MPVCDAAPAGMVMVTAPTGAKPTTLALPEPATLTVTGVSRP